LKYLLDTNAWIEYLRGNSSLMLQNLKAHPARDVFLCSVVVGELRFGILNGDPNKFADNEAALRRLTKKYKSIYLDDGSAFEAAKIRLELARLGTPIGPYDLLIAAIARVRGYTLVTHNTSEFGRIPNLLIEDWQV
jgi:tRNA(fMet)-specific endonuclease VapC